MMQHITGISRNQMVFSSLEDTISNDHPIRFIDAFVDTINLHGIGFTVKTLKTEGRPSFDTKIFLQPYLCGFHKGFLVLKNSKKNALEILNYSGFCMPSHLLTILHPTIENTIPLDFSNY